jgi:hypothetical protein
LGAGAAADQKRICENTHIPHFRHEEMTTCAPLLIQRNQLEGSILRSDDGAMATSGGAGCRAQITLPLAAVFSLRMKNDGAVARGNIGEPIGQRSAARWRRHISPALLWEFTSMALPSSESVLRVQEMKRWEWRYCLALQVLSGWVLQAGYGAAEWRILAVCSRYSCSTCAFRRRAGASRHHKIPPCKCACAASPG